MNKKILIPFFLSTLYCVSSCKKDVPVEPTRSFYMGVTPWPGDFTIAEVDTAYQFINGHCDIVSQHFDDGIPYEEAWHNLPMPQNFQKEVQTRKTKTTGKKTFLSVAALNLTRKEKADYYSNVVVTDSIKNYWKQIPFNNPKIVTAYINYISWLIDQFQPVYVNYGVESNLPSWDPGQFALYKTFLQQVFSELKIKYPSLPFFVSFMVDESSEGLANAAQLLPYTDFIGLSAYPYVSVSSSANGNTDPGLFPANYFERFINLDAGKPMAFAETGYIAEDILIPSFNLNKKGNADWQNKYLASICELCEKRKAKLLVWFCSKDYDKGNATLQSLGLYQDLFGLWQDIGLKDENGQQRPAYQTWTQWVGRKKTD